MTELKRGGAAKAALFYIIHPALRAPLFLEGNVVVEFSFMSEGLGLHGYALIAKLT